MNAALAFISILGRLYTINQRIHEQACNVYHQLSITTSELASSKPSTLRSELEQWGKSIELPTKIEPMILSIEPVFVF